MDLCNHCINRLLSRVMQKRCKTACHSSAAHFPMLLLSLLLYCFASRLDQERIYREGSGHALVEKEPVPTVRARQGGAGWDNT